MSDLYNSTDFIELVLSQLRVSEAVLKRAKVLQLLPEDFLSPGVYNLPVYQLIARAFLKEASPTSLEVNFLRLNEDPDLLAHLLPQVADTVIRIANQRSDPALEAYVLEHLQPFIKARRSAKIVTEANGDLERMAEEWRKTIFPIDLLNAQDVAIDTRFVNPFSAILKKPIFSMISTGFPKLDAALGGGLAYREFGLIVGHSGGGKTALGTSFARGAALSGKKVIYCSMEEQKEDIANRMYADIFELDYTSLHNGTAYMQLEEKMANPSEAEKMLLLRDNLLVLDLKGMTPMKPSQLKQIVDDYAVKNGFHFDLLIIDQLQFMEPDTLIPNEQEWLKEKRTVKEVDELSHKAIGDLDKYYGVWLIHQAKGKLKSYFSTEEISGFKGIIHTPETVLGIGRDNPTSTDFEIFSMKSRHSKNFRLPIYGDLTYMRFVEKAEAPGDAQSIARISVPSNQAAAVTPMSSGNYSDPALAGCLAPGVTTPGKKPAVAEGISAYG